MMNLDQLLAAQLAKLEAGHLRRILRISDDEAKLLNFASNDYLGLSRHPALISAAERSAGAEGTGAGASRLISGTSAAVLALESALADWKQQEAALVFSSGYAAALGAIPALVGRGDTILLDKLAHASLIDAARLSGATVRVYPHNNLDRLAILLQKLASSPGRRLIVTESIFSMDGDQAPLAGIVALKEKHGAFVLVDEAHATGLYGPGGAGLVAELGLSSRVEILLATQSKALGSVGGMIAGSRTLIDWLINRARSFVYSTALPPGAVAASRAAVELLQTLEGGRLRTQLQENVQHFTSNLPARWSGPATSQSAIQPLHCGLAEEAIRLSENLRAAEFFVPAIRYPTVARNAARLRITLSAAHTSAQIDQLLRALVKFA